MTAPAPVSESTGSAPTLHLALELGKLHWKLGFTAGLGREPRYRTIRAGQVERLTEEIEAARERSDPPEEAEVVSCCEAGRDGFWLHRCLVAQGVNSHVGDSSSIELPRWAKRRETDRIRSLLALHGLKSRARSRLSRAAAGGPIVGR